MAKNIRFESFVYRLLATANENGYKSVSPDAPSWAEFLNSLVFSSDGEFVNIVWEKPSAGNISMPLSGALFYAKTGNAEADSSNIAGQHGRVKFANAAFFSGQVSLLAAKAGYMKDLLLKDPEAGDRVSKERVFHDLWADSENIDLINVAAINSVCTAPEMRYITGRLGDLRGKRLLDIGCGLGEASVHFAMRGAIVTASDLSQGMLNAASRLAEKNGVRLKRHLAAAEDMAFGAEDKFDIVYAGNLFHHVNIEETILRIKPCLKQGGVLVSWDPLAYNPLINLYRYIASDVRTADEHPLTRRDINIFKKNFSRVEEQYFWFFTLVIFVLMFLARRNPNKERFWKVVVNEGDKWRGLYEPLEKLDQMVLRLCPPLKWLCWNIVLVCTP